MVVWLCHARVGHRQGLYPRRPPHPGRPSSLCDVVAAAIVDRELQQVTARGFTQEGLPSGEAFVFVSFLSWGVAVAIVDRDPQQVTARGFIQEGLPSGEAFVFDRLGQERPPPQPAPESRGGSTALASLLPLLAGGGWEGWLLILREERPRPNPPLPAGEGAHPRAPCRSPY